MCVKSFFVKITMVLLYITLFCGNVEIKFMKSKSEYFVISIDWPKHLEREITLIYMHFPIESNKMKFSPSSYLNHELIMNKKSTIYIENIETTRNLQPL